MEWDDWDYGGCVFAPDRRDGEVEQTEILRRVAVGFRRVTIDWTEGDRWVEARIVKAVAIGYRGFLLEAEHSLRGRSVLVAVSDDAGPGGVWVRFSMTPDTGALEVSHQPASAVEAGRAVARKLADILGYEFTAEP